MYVAEHFRSDVVRHVDPMLPQWHEVQRFKRETHDTFTIELAVQQGRTDFQFAPGQFNMLYVYGVGEVPISISGDPARTDRLVHTIRAAGTVTRAMAQLKRGDTVGVRGPFGKPWPMNDLRYRDVIVVAGGIGLAPLRPVLYHMLRNRTHYENVHLLYGARTSDDLLYSDELLCPTSEPGINVKVTVDRAGPSWKGNIGVVTTLIPNIEVNPARTVALVCGPEVMMRFTVKALTQLGIHKDQIFVSMERNMKCAIGFCGHCQYGPAFICKDGPVFRYDRVENLLNIREL